MPKRRAGEVAEKICEAFLVSPAKPLSIQESSKISGVNWESTKRYLELFGKVGLVKEIKEENEIRYIKIGAYEKDTLFRLPLSQVQKDTINKIYVSIKKICPRGKPLPSTAMQKIAVDVSEKIDVNIPKGWYLFGEILILPPDNASMNSQTPFPEGSTEFELIREACGEYLQCKNTHEVCLLQYEKKRNLLYSTKEKLYSILTSLCHEESAERMNSARKLINDFAMLAEKNHSDSTLVLIIEDYCTSLLSIFRNSNQKQIQKAQGAVIEAFLRVWDLTATHEFSKSLEKYYEKEILTDFFSSRFEEAEHSAIEALERLRQHEPKFDFPQTEEAKKLMSLMGSAKELSEEEKEKRKKELEEISPSELFRRYGLD